jgi:hypothetical protein
VNHYYGSQEQRQQSRFSSNEMSVFYGYLDSQGLLGSKRGDSVDMSKFHLPVPGSGAALSDEQRKNAEQLFNFVRWTDSSVDTFPRTYALRQTVEHMDTVNAKRAAYREMKSRYIEGVSSQEALLSLGVSWMEMRNAEIAASRADADGGLLLSDKERASIRQQRQNVDFSNVGKLLNAMDTQQDTLFGYLSEQTGFDKIVDITKAFGIDDVLIKPDEGRKLAMASVALQRAEKRGQAVDARVRERYEEDRDLFIKKWTDQGYGWMVDQMFERDAEGRYTYMHVATEKKFLQPLRELGKAQDRAERLERGYAAWQKGEITLDNFGEYFDLPFKAEAITKASAELRSAYIKDSKEPVGLAKVKEILSKHLSISVDKIDDATAERMVSYAAQEETSPVHFFRKLGTDFVKDVFEVTDDQLSYNLHFPYSCWQPD